MTNNTRKKVHDTREAWLMGAVAIMAPRFKANDTPLPKKIRVTVGFPSTGSQSKKVIGQHFATSVSADGTHEIIVHTRIDNALHVLGILTHELCHAAAPAGAKHGGAFSSIGKALLLEGKPTEMTNGDDYDKEIGKPITAEIGKFPHAKLELTSAKKQTTRLMKCECAGCGYVARITRKWVNDSGAPLCPDDSCTFFEQPMTVEPM